MNHRPRQASSLEDGFSVRDATTEPTPRGSMKRDEPKAEMRLDRPAAGQFETQSSWQHTSHAGREARPLSPPAIFAGKSAVETAGLDEINQALNLTRERDPSIEPEPGYSPGSQSEQQLSVACHATNLSILTAAVFTKGYTPREAADVAIELYNDIQRLAHQYSRVAEMPACAGITHKEKRRKRLEEKR